MPTLPLPSGILNLVLVAGRNRVITATVTGIDITNCTHLAQFRRTADLNSNVLFQLSSSGTNAQITQSGQAVTFQFLPEDTEDLGGANIYWAWRIEFPSPSFAVVDFLEGDVAIQSTPTA